MNKIISQNKLALLVNLPSSELQSIAKLRSCPSICVCRVRLYVHFYCSELRAACIVSKSLSNPAWSHVCLGGGGEGLIVQRLTSWLLLFVTSETGTVYLAHVTIIIIAMMQQQDLVNIY